MNKRICIDEITPFLKNGMTIAIGGFMGCGNPHNLITQLLKTDVKDLTLVATDTARDNFGIGKLIDGRRIKKLYTSHIGTNKNTQKQVLEGSLAIQLVPQGTLVERIRCKAAGLGGFLTKTGLGTEVQEGKKVIHIDGEDYLLEEPIQIDLSLIKAYKSDESGNLIYSGSSRNFNTSMAGAADITIVEVDEVVPNGELDPNFIHTPFIYTNYICEASS